MVKFTLIIRCVFTVVYIIFAYNKRWIVENLVESVDKCIGHAILESMNKKCMRCLCKPQIGKMILLVMTTLLYGITICDIIAA